MFQTPKLQGDIRRWNMSSTIEDSLDRIVQRPCTKFSMVQKVSEAGVQNRSSLKVAASLLDSGL